jgi:hypothetical protein
MSALPAHCDGSLAASALAASACAFIRVKGKPCG